MEESTKMLIMEFHTCNGIKTPHTHTHARTHAHTHLKRTPDILKLSKKENTAMGAFLRDLRRSTLTSDDGNRQTREVKCLLRREERQCLLRRQKKPAFLMSHAEKPGWDKHS